MLTALDNQTALVLIDLQQGILAMPLAHPPATIVQQGAQLAEAFRRAHLPVVLVTVNPIGAPWTLVRADINDYPQQAAEQAHVRQLLTDNGFFTLDPALTQQAQDLLVTKTAWDAFYDTDLHALLQARGVTGIVLGGVATSIGVEGTARGANARGYNLTFAADAMTDAELGAHQHSVRHIFPRLGEVTTTAAIIAKLASHG